MSAAVSELWRWWVATWDRREGPEVLAAIRIGVVPVPLYPPLSFGNVDAYVERTQRILQSAGARVLVTSARLSKVLWSLVDRVDSLERVAAAEGLGDKVTTAPVYPDIAPEDLCFLQYTSGSTADPKGVMVTHASLVANAKAIITSRSASPTRWPSSMARSDTGRPFTISIR